MLLIVCAYASDSRINNKKLQIIYNGKKEMKGIAFHNTHIICFNSFIITLDAKPWIRKCASYKNLVKTRIDSGTVKMLYIKTY